MGALPQTNIAVPVQRLRKPVTRESRTDYKTGNGWAALPHAAVDNLMDLSSGEVCLKFLIRVNDVLAAAGRTPKEAWAAWTDARSTQEWADSCRAGVRDIQRVFEYLQGRGMIGVKQSKAGAVVKYSVSLLYAKWPALESYDDWRRKQKVVMIDEAAAELAEDEAVPEIAKDAVRLCKTPQRIAPGRASRSVRVNTGVKSFQVVNGSDVELIYDPVVSSGCLTFSVAGVKSESKAKGDESSTFNPAPIDKRDMHVADFSRKPLITNEVEKKTRKAESLSGESKVVGGPTVLIVTNPRAAELATIFDPLLAASGARLLSGDPQSLKAACEAVQDCDHAFLVKFALQRAERPVKSPLHIATICAEALASWQVSKVLDGAGLGSVSMTDIKAMAAKERAARLGKKR